MTNQAEQVLDAALTLVRHARNLADADRAYHGYRSHQIEVEDATQTLVSCLGVEPLDAWRALNADQPPSKAFLDSIGEP